MAVTNSPTEVEEIMMQSPAPKYFKKSTRKAPTWRVVRPAAAEEGNYSLTPTSSHLEVRLDPATGKPGVWFEEVVERERDSTLWMARGFLTADLRYPPVSAPVLISQVYPLERQATIYVSQHSGASTSTPPKESTK